MIGKLGQATTYLPFYDLPTYMPIFLWPTYLPQFFFIWTEIWLVKNDQSNGPYSTSQKTTPITLDMLKFTSPKRQSGLFDACSNWVFLKLDLPNKDTMFSSIEIP
jgi:hypothetical protein